MGPLEVSGATPVLEVEAAPTVTTAAPTPLVFEDIFSSVVPTKQNNKAKEAVKGEGGRGRGLDTSHFEHMIFPGFVYKIKQQNTIDHKGKGGGWGEELHNSLFEHMFSSVVPTRYKTKQQNIGRS